MRSRGRTARASIRTRGGGGLLASSKIEEGSDSGARRGHLKRYKQEKTISVAELAEKLKPIIKELMIQGRANMATASPATVLYNAGKLQIGAS